MIGDHSSSDLIRYPIIHPIKPVTQTDQSESGQFRMDHRISVLTGFQSIPLVEYCQLCKLKIENITRIECCMRKILSLEEDFKSQKSQLQEEIEKKDIWGFVIRNTASGKKAILR